MREEFEKLAAGGKINSKNIEVLTVLAQTGYCVHRSWGFGRITTVDTVFSMAPSGPHPEARAAGLEGRPTRPARPL